MNKTYINTNERFDEDILRLQAINPDFDKSTLIRFAVRAAADANLVLGMSHTPVAAMTTASAKNKEKAQSKEDWCTAFGGEVKNGVCQIYKYETTFSGHIAKDFRPQSIASFPMDREEFRKQVLENWESPEEEEKAYLAKPAPAY